MRLPRGILLLLVLACLAGCGEAPRLAALPAGSVVLAFGDSVTHGTGAAPGEDYPARLAALTGWDVRNHGVPGDTAQAARARIAAALEETQPALVLLEIGGNDFLRQRKESQVREDIRAILATVRAQRIPVVLIAVPGFSPLGAAVGRLSDSPIYETLATEEKLPLVANVFADVLSDPALKADAIHPNAHGYRRLAEGIAAALRETGLLASR
ncbi:MAG: GDSL-type esterase/lipase family protein [Proteobacteria bacterium]|nr:GDSL-type esterase/lipase family protein [Pseudomonadota bacterium]